MSVGKKCRRGLIGDNGRKFIKFIYNFKFKIIQLFFFGREDGFTLLAKRRKKSYLGNLRIIFNLIQNVFKICHLLYIYIHCYAHSKFQSNPSSRLEPSDLFPKMFDSASLYGRTDRLYHNSSNARKYL